MQEALACLPRYPEVVGDGELVEYAFDLQRALDAKPADLMGLEAGNVLAIEKYAPAADGQQSRNEIEEGRLAGAVRPDDRVQLPSRQRQAEIVDRDEAAESLRQMLGAKDRFAHDFVGKIGPLMARYAARSPAGF